MNTAARLSHYVNGVVGTAALITSATSTQAAIVYWNPPDKTLRAISPIGEALSFDMVTGVVENLFSPASSIPSGFKVWDNGIGDYNVQIRSFTGLTPPFVGEPTLSRLAAGAVVGAASSFSGGDVGYFDKQNFSGHPWNTDLDGTTGYVGLRFPISGNTHYGWAHFTYNDASGTLTLHDFAYENVPGASILAGAIVPEPGSALLALAGLAGATLRRRRS